MTFSGILFSAAILGIVALYVAKPLLQPRFGRRRRIGSLEHLQIQKEALLIQISDLDFDYETGKLTGADYEIQRSTLMDEATSVLMQIDQFETASAGLDAPGALEKKKPADVDAEIEAAIADIRTSDHSDSNLDIGEESAQVSANGTVSCPDCGREADLGDRFCTVCGHDFRQPQHA